MTGRLRNGIEAFILLERLRNPQGDIPDIVCEFWKLHIFYQRSDLRSEIGGVHFHLKQAFLIFIVVSREQGGIQNIQHQQNGHAGREGADF